MSGKEYSCYIITSNGKVLKQFKQFSFSGINLKNIIYYNKEIIVPAYKKVIFLKSGSTLAEARVSQIDCGVIDENSKISIVNDSQRGNTFCMCKIVNKNKNKFTNSDCLTYNMVPGYY